MAWVDFFLFVSSPKKEGSHQHPRCFFRQESTPDAVAKENHVRKTLGMNFGGWEGCGGLCFRKVLGIAGVCLEGS